MARPGQLNPSTTVRRHRSFSSERNWPDSCRSPKRRLSRRAASVPDLVPRRRVNQRTSLLSDAPRVPKSRDKERLGTLDWRTARKGLFSCFLLLASALAFIGPAGAASVRSDWSDQIYNSINGQRSANGLA